MSDDITALADAVGVLDDPDEYTLTLPDLAWGAVSCFSIYASLVLAGLSQGGPL